MQVTESLIERPKNGKLTITTVRKQHMLKAQVVVSHLTGQSFVSMLARNKFTISNCLTDVAGDTYT